MSGKEQYYQAFRDVYMQEFPYIIKSTKGITFAFCTVCRDINIGHSGKNDIKNHGKTAKHISNAKSTEDRKQIQNYFVKNANQDNSVIKSECLFTSFLIEHNLPLSVADHAGPLFRKMFPTSDAAKKYGCGRTKTTAIVKEMASNVQNDIVAHLQTAPYALSTDGSNDSDSKLYPLVVTYYDGDMKKMVSCILSLPVLLGDATGRNIGDLMLAELEKLKVPVANMIDFSADNAAVMLGCRSGVATVLKNTQENLIVMGCLCHLVNLAAEKGASKLPAKIDDILVDIYYFLEKSCKRKESLATFQDLHNTEAKKIFKHVCTRWLSLGRSLARLVDQWEPLLSFFKAEITNQKPQSASLTTYRIPKQSTLKGTNKLGENVDSSSQIPSCSHVPPKDSRSSADKSAMDIASCRPTSTPEIIDKLPAVKGSECKNSTKRKADEDSRKSKKKVVKSSSVSSLSGNKLSLKSQVPNLNREEKIFMFLSMPLNRAFCLFLLTVIPTFERDNVILQSSKPKIHILRDILYDLLKELLSKFVKPTVIKNNDLLEVRYHCVESQRQDTDLVIGHLTSQIVHELEETDKKTFYESVRSYFVTSCDYTVNKFPMKKEVLLKATVANIEVIENSSFSDVEYFLKLFPFMFTLHENETRELAIDVLHNQFTSLQLEDISSLTTQSDIVEKWSTVEKINGVDGKPKFDRLARMMFSILTIPHSNAECERVFSVVKKNRTQFRSQLSNNCLERLSLIKSRQVGACYEQVFTDEFLQKAKKATAASLK